MVDVNHFTTSDAQPLLNVLGNPDLWREGRTAAKNYRKLVLKASRNSKYSVARTRVRQEDPVRLLQGAFMALQMASSHAVVLLEKTKAIAQVEQILEELKMAEDKISGTHYSFFSLEDRRAKKVALRDRDNKEDRVRQYFETSGLGRSLSYGSALALLHQHKSRIIREYNEHINEALLTLEDWMQKSCRNPRQIEG